MKGEMQETEDPAFGWATVLPAVLVAILL